MWFIWCVTSHRGTNRKWNLEFNKTPFLPCKLLDIYKHALRENLYRHGKNFYWAEFTRLYTCFMQNIGTLPYSYFAWEGKIGQIFVQCVNYLTWNCPYIYDDDDDVEHWNGNKYFCINIYWVYTEVNINWIQRFIIMRLKNSARHHELQHKNIKYRVTTRQRNVDWDIFHEAKPS